MNFVNRSPRPSRQPDSLTPSPDCGGMPRAIGRERTNLPSRTKAPKDRGYANDEPPLTQSQCGGADGATVAAGVVVVGVATL